MNQIEKIWNLLVDLYSNPVYLQQFINNRFILILLVVFLIRLKYATYRSMWLAAVINIPGTFLHEFMHFVVGLFTNAHPEGLELLPKKAPDSGGYIMGSVSFSNLTFYNAFPTAFAPLGLLVIGYCINRFYLPQITPTYLNYIGYVLFQTIIIENSIPSSVDIRQAFRYPQGTVLYFAIFATFLYFI